MYMAFILLTQQQRQTDMVRASQTEGNKAAKPKKTAKKPSAVSSDESSVKEKVNKTAGGDLIGKEKRAPAAAAPAADGDDGDKPKRHWRSGTVAKRDMKKLQKATSLQLRKGPFERIVREVLDEIKDAEDPDAIAIRIKHGCFGLLQDTTERYMVGLYRKSIPARNHGKRKTLKARDVRLVYRILEDGDNPFVEGPNNTDARAGG